MPPTPPAPRRRSGTGGHLSFAYPHDGDNREEGSGRTFAEMYREHGLRMHHERAIFPDGGNIVEAGLPEMIERFGSRRLAVFDHLHELFTRSPATTGATGAPSRARTTRSTPSATAS